MFPQAKKVTLYRLTEDGKSLGVFQKIGSREALGNPAARQGKLVTQNSKTRAIREKFAFFVPANLE